MENLSTLENILLFTFLGSIVSLIGGLALVYKEKLAIKFSRYLASFAAGALLGTAFFDLLPEALHEGAEDLNIFGWTLTGFLVFFLVDRLIRWFHNHSFQRDYEDNTDHKPTVLLVLIGDSVHNFIDGVVIAATFMVSVPLGVVTTLAVAAHEIPQEIGDFGILLHRKVPKRKVLFYNFLSALTAITGALITFYLGEFTISLIPIFLSITAGFFIYIAASDLIPEIHYKDSERFAYVESVLLLIGVLTIYIATSLLEH